ncbi:MAG: (d)CMP kinase [Patescibacteria group bacterium]
MNNKFQIAVDGPVAAGKGTVCRLVAERLGILYVDTGAMYRVAAMVAMSAGVDFQDEEKLVPLIKSADIQLKIPQENEKDGRLLTILLDGKDVSWQIRTEIVGHGSSQVAKLAGVRQALVKKQQDIAENQSVVMEGRDITYRVLPDAKLKIYLTGSDLVRAKRRHQQLLGKGRDLSFEEVRKDLLQRDHDDTTREHDPLQIVSDAWVIDTSDMPIGKVVSMIIDRVKAIISSNKHE